MRPADLRRVLLSAFSEIVLLGTRGESGYVSPMPLWRDLETMHGTWPESVMRFDTATRDVLLEIVRAGVALEVEEHGHAER